MSEFTVGIQGPLSYVSLDYIEDYLKFGKVVVSHWENDPLAYEIPDEVSTIVVAPLPTPVYYLGKTNQTFTYQIHSIRNGLTAVDTKYVVRTRSDEFFNLDALVSKFLEDDSKVVCGSIFFKKWSSIPLHMGDHLFVGKTANLLDAYTRLCNNPARYNNMHCAEQSSSVAILDAYGDSVDKEGFANRFDVVDINKLKPFVANWQHGNTIYRDRFEYDDVIREISEL